MPKLNQSDSNDVLGENASISAVVPSRSLLKYAGPGIGVAGLMTALLTFLSKDTHGALQLLGQFGPKYVFWSLFASLGFGLARLMIKSVVKLGQQLVDHFGRLVENTGNGAIALTEGAAALKTVRQRSEAVTQEMQLQIGYVAQQQRDTREEMRTQSTHLIGISRALMRLEDKLGITPEIAETKS